MDSNIQTLSNSPKTLHPELRQVLEDNICKTQDSINSALLAAPVQPSGEQLIPETHAQCTNAWHQHQFIVYGYLISFSVAPIEHNQNIEKDDENMNNTDTFEPSM